MICFFVSKPFWKLCAILLLIFTKGWCYGFNIDLSDCWNLCCFYCFSLFLVVAFWSATRKGTIPWRCWLLKSLLFLLSFLVVSILIFCCFYFHSLLFLLSFFVVSIVNLCCFYCLSLLFLLSLFVVSIVILCCFYCHSSLFLLSFLVVSIFILRCFDCHSAWFLLSFFVASNVILRCFYCHSLLLLVAVPLEKGTMPWLGQRQNPD